MNIWPKPVLAIDEIPGELPGDSDSLRRWQESLDALHGEAEAALRQDRKTETPGNDKAGWVSPDDLGPLPESLLDRARAVAALQQQVVAMLATSRDGVERELAEITRPRQQVSPVYVDVTG